MGRNRGSYPEPAPSRGAADGPEAIDAATDDALSIVALAERAAFLIVRGAEIDARRYLSVTKESADLLTRGRAELISASSDSLLRDADVVRSEARDLLQVIGLARRKLAGGDASSSGGR